MTEPDLAAGYEAADFNTIVGLKYSDDKIEVIIFAPGGQADLKNPAVFFGDWLASNWDEVNEACSKAYRLRFADHTITQSALLGADGMPVNS